MPPRFIARQLAHPAGIFAPVIGFLMNRHNARMNAFAIDCLGPGITDRLLEIGFGGGLTLERLTTAAGHYCGVDRSADVVAGARRRFASAVKAGRVSFLQGSIEQMPVETGSVDKCLTVNTIYFWTSLEQGFSEIHRVLAPGGLAVIGFLPKQQMDRMGMPTDIFTTRDAEDALQAMKQAGFIDVRLCRPDLQTSWVALVGRHP